MKEIFGRRPLALVLIVLGIMFLLLGLSEGIDLPVLKRVAVLESTRWFALILGLALLGSGLASFQSSTKGADPLIDVPMYQATDQFVETVGLEHIYLDLKESWDPIIQAMTEAKKRIQLVGISHTFNLAGHAFEETIKQFLLKPDAKVDVFFLDPNSKAIAQRAHAEDTAPETFREEVLAGVHRTAQWKKAHPNRVRLFYYDAYPVWRLERIDNDLIFCHSYPPGARGNAGAVMKLKRVDNNGSLFAAFDSIMDRLESGSKPVPEAPTP